MSKFGAYKGDFFQVTFVGDGECHVNNIEINNGIQIVTIVHLKHVHVMLSNVDGHNASLPLDDYGLDPVRFFDKTSESDWHIKN